MNRSFPTSRMIERADYVRTCTLCGDCIRYRMCDCVASLYERPDQRPRRPKPAIMPKATETKAAATKAAEMPNAAETPKAAETPAESKP